MTSVFFNHMKVSLVQVIGQEPFPFNGRDVREQVRSCPDSAKATLEMKLGTLGCAASLNRYGAALNRCTGEASVLHVKPP